MRAILTAFMVGAFALQWKHPELAFHNATVGLIINMVWLWG